MDALSATNAYKNQLKMLQDNPVADAAQTDDANKPSFFGMVESALKGVADQQHGAEALQMQSMTGKVELSDLVTAVSSAELTLNTVLAVRDKVISAYQEILRMPM